jgi:hypothetical protein
LPFGCSGEHRTCLHAANLDIVEGQVEGAAVLDQTVIGDDRNAFVGSGLNGGNDRLGVLRQNDQRVDALSHQAFNVGKLLGGRGLRVGGNIGVAGSFDRGLHGGFVGFPALFLEVRPGNADKNSPIGWSVPVRSLFNCTTRSSVASFFSTVEKINVRLHPCCQHGPGMPALAGSAPHRLQGENPCRN